jgi:hypothetical protein
VFGATNLYSIILTGIGNDGAYRLFANYGIEWVFPEYFSSDTIFEYAKYIQPTLKWSFMPKIILGLFN